MMETLHRVKLKFLGCQKIHISKKWGFTEFNADEPGDMVVEKQLIPSDWPLTQTTASSVLSHSLIMFTNDSHIQPENYTDMGT